LCDRLIYASAALGLNVRICRDEVRQRDWRRPQGTPFGALGQLLGWMIKNVRSIPDDDSTLRIWPVTPS